MTRPSGPSLFWVNDFPPVTSGIATFFVNICRHLPSEKIVVLAPSMPGDQAIDVSLPFIVRRLLLPIGESGTAKLIKTVLTVLYVLLETLRGKPARHHCGQVLSSGIAGLVCRRLFGVPYVVVYGSETVRLAGSRVGKRLIQAVLNHSDRVVANSRHTADEFIRFGVGPEKVQVVYPGVDTLRFCPAPPDLVLIERYGLEDRQILLTVARLDERKGHDTVIRALAGLVSEHPRLLYLIAGKGREGPRLEALVKTLHLEDHVRFLGFVPDEGLPALYNLCDVFVMPKRVTTESVLAGDIEGFGISFVEASACGKPVIADRSGGAVEAVADGETGLVIDPSSDTELSNAIQRLLGDADLRRRMGDAGRRRVETTYDWHLLARQIQV